MNKKNTIILGIIFPVLLIVVMIITIIMPDKKFSGEENRILQELPSFSLSMYKDGRFEKKMENYVNDQFIMRNGFIKIKTAFDRTLGKTDENDVFFCKDNYLMENIQAPDEVSMKKNLNAIRSFREKYSNLNMSFLLAPNAADIYPEKLPIKKTEVNQDKIIDSFYKELESLGIKTIDVREDFRKQKDDVQLYYRTDHHWTTDGAYIAFKDINKNLGLGNKTKYNPLVVKNDFRGTLASKSGFTNGLNDEIKVYVPEDKSDFKPSVIYYSDSKEKTTQFYQLDNLKTKDAYTVFGGSNHPIYTITTPTKSDRRLLLIKDSYANSIIPFLSQCYREIVIVDPRYFFDDINEIIDSKNITDVLFLYNANTFVKDDSLQMTLTPN